MKLNSRKLGRSQGGALSSTRKSPTGPRQRKALADASSKSSAAKMISASMWKLPSASFTCLTISRLKLYAQAEETSAVISSKDANARRAFVPCPSSPFMAKPRATSTMPSSSVNSHNGNFEFQVHIADVAHDVRPKVRSIWKRACAGPAFIFPIAPFPCCRWSSRPTFAVCARKWIAWCFPVSWKSIIGRNRSYEPPEGVIRSAERMTYTDVNAVLEGDAARAQNVRQLGERL